MSLLFIRNFFYAQTHTGTGGDVDGDMCSFYLSILITVDTPVILSSAFTPQNCVVYVCGETDWAIVPSESE